jgi:hypothetical protein
MRLLIGCAALAVAMVIPIGAARAVLGGIVTLFATRRQASSASSQPE